MGRVGGEDGRQRMLASLESETLVYLAMPSLRAKSFTQTIWADRFLTEEPDAAVMRDAAIRAAHRSFMLMSGIGSAECLTMLSSSGLRRFSTRTKRGRRSGARTTQVVERGMRTFRGSRRATNVGCGRWFLDWYGRSAEPNGIPFRTEAEQFAEVYWRSRA